ncbi:YgcG family protein [Granulicella sp. S190]|uniref:TPM domain-containing protein n=1 Tax=Granulicella sp. S190 TaxID=1747226 RepID=UPI00131E6355|nr:TPM domain-containing protein [Granulicella sp. S190]
MNYLSRWLAIALLIFAPSLTVTAESVSTLPAPTGYVNDFAGVLTPSTKYNLESLCTQVDRQAHAQIAVVTVKTMDGDQSIEEFATALEDKWKVGAKGTDRGVLMLFVMTPRRGRIEVGYGLEGILNDAKVGDIGRSMVPAAQQGDYNTAIPLGVQQIARIIATDAGVALTVAQPVHQYHREQQPVQLSLTQVVLGGGAILLILFFLVKTGNTGLIFFLLGNLMGGGGGGFGGGRGRDDDRGGGGFGGFGGGSSGGGGASGDF